MKVPATEHSTHTALHSTAMQMFPEMCVVEARVCVPERTGRTVGEHAWGRELDVGQRSQVVEHSAPVALPLGVIHKGADVVLLAVVADARADHHGEVICTAEEKKANNAYQWLIEEYLH